MAGITNPTRFVHSAVSVFTDDSAIPAGGITKYQYGFGQQPGQYSIIKDDADLTADENGKQIYLVPAMPTFGQWYAAGRAVSKDGVTAKWGNEIPFVTAPKEPKPITDFSVA